ncbi:MAG: glycosyltransferase family 2 protein [Burkholderiales bacterium]
MSGEISTNAVPMPLVSVLIPAFNHERFVQRCLDSVLVDPYPTREIVIIDDGSTDATGERIAEWAERHRDDIHVEFVQRGNRGIAATLNELAARARGEFLKLGASDDYLLPGGLDAQVHYLLTHPMKWAVIGDSIIVDKHGTKLHDSGMRHLGGVDKRMYRSDEGIRRAVISQWAIGGPVALIRKRSLETVAGWSEVLCIDDWDFFLRLAAHDAIGFVDMKVCAYRLHDTNVSQTRDVRKRISHLLESRDVALRRADLFGGTDRVLLIAQAHYINAKVAFLQRKTGDLARHMAAYVLLLLVSKTRLRSGAQVKA